MITKQVIMESLDIDELTDKIAEKLMPRFQKYLEDLYTEKTDELLSRKEIAGYLKISIITVSVWSKKGIIYTRRIGNLILFKK